MSKQGLIIEENESFLCIKFNRPEAANSITKAMLVDLLSILEEPRNKLLIVTGENQTFSKGRDPGPKSKSVEEVRYGLELVGKVNQALKAWPLPTIAVVEGEALGAALGLILHCDFAIASSDASFGFPEILHGIAPTIVASYLPDFLGHRMAANLLFTGRRMSSTEALQLGIITNYVEPAQLQTEVNRLIETLQSMNPEALAYTKRGLIELPNTPQALRMQEGIDRVVTWLVEH